MNLPDQNNLSITFQNIHISNNYFTNSIEKDSQNKNSQIINNNNTPKFENKKETSNRIRSSLSKSIMPFSNINETYEKHVNIVNKIKKEEYNSSNIYINKRENTISPNDSFKLRMYIDLYNIKTYLSERLLYGTSFYSNYNTSNESNDQIEIQNQNRDKDQIERMVTKQCYHYEKKYEINEVNLFFIISIEMNIINKGNIDVVDRIINLIENLLLSSISKYVDLNQNIQKINDEIKRNIIVIETMLEMYYRIEVNDLKNEYKQYSIIGIVCIENKMIIFRKGHIKIIVSTNNGEKIYCLGEKNKKKGNLSKSIKTNYETDICHITYKINI